MAAHLALASASVRNARLIGHVCNPSNHDSPPRPPVFLPRSHPEILLSFSSVLVPLPVMLILRLLTVSVLAVRPWAMPTAPYHQGLTKAALPTPTAASSSSVEAAAQLAQLSKVALGVSMEDLARKQQTRHQRGGCTAQNVRVRRNWREFSRREKKDWISSVLCLQGQRPRTPSPKAPGARTRYDDFVATHINQTMYIHYSVRGIPALRIGLQLLTRSRPGHVLGLAPLVYI